MGHGCLLWAALLPALLHADEPGAPAPAVESGIPWADYDLSHVANNEPIVDLLREFANDQGLPVVTSEKVTGTISGKFGPLHPEKFLDAITQNNGLIWTYDGTALYVYRGDEIRTEIIPVRGAQIDEVIDALKLVGVWSDKYPIRVLESRNLLYITGPPRYLDVVKELATKIQLQAARQANVEVVMEVFPLQYAWADDQSFLLAGNQVIVPGVATILQNLINGPGSGQGSSTGGRQVTQAPYNLPTLRGTGLIAPYNDALAQAQQSARNAELVASEARGRQEGAELARAAAAGESDSPEADLAATVQPVIQADPRLNAIVIKDVRERMAGYRDIIRQLDHPSGLVQIEASIIDVDAESGFEWSPDAVFQWLKGDPTGSIAVRPQPVPDAASNLTLALGSAGVYSLMSKFRALETEGHARLVSRPTVLTINNVEATLNSQEEFFVRVNGFETSDLFNVQIGTVLRIIPHIVEEGQGRRIKLIVTVEDGRRTEDEVDDVPVIARNSINTQAVLNEGDSLLIGGLIREEVTKNVRRLPIVGRIPGVKYLFASQDNEKRRLERIVLITPKVIELPDLNCQMPGIIPGAPMLNPESFPDLELPPVTQTKAEVFSEVSNRSNVPATSATRVPSTKSPSGPKKRPAWPRLMKRTGPAN